MAATQQTGPSRSTAALLRVILASLTVILTVELYTGAPLMAIWVGSRVQKGTQLTMTTVLVVIGVLALLVWLLVFLLTRVEAAYRVLTNQPTKRRVAPWLKSMRAEREEVERRPLTGFEKAIAGSVAVAVIGFHVWFLFFAGSPIG